MEQKRAEDESFEEMWQRFDGELDEVLWDMDPPDRVATTPIKSAMIPTTAEAAVKTPAVAAIK